MAHVNGRDFDEMDGEEKPGARPGPQKGDALTADGEGVQHGVRHGGNAKKKEGAPKTDAQATMQAGSDQGHGKSDCQRVGRPPVKKLCPGGDAKLEREHIKVRQNGDKNSRQKKARRDW